MSTLRDDINLVIGTFPTDNPTRKLFRERLAQDFLTREENPASHFCVEFLPFNPATKKVLLAHHKVSGLWISPGGHIEPNESLFDALNREIGEELGLHNYFATLPKPFQITHTTINNVGHACKEHFQLWFLLKTDGSHFVIDPGEFHETKWVDFSEANNLLTHEPNLRAIRYLEDTNKGFNAR